MARAASPPTKLKRDAIVEAILEIRFDSAIVPEVFFGRIVDDKAWRKFTQHRLPTADVPTVIRDADATLRFQPAFELVSPSSGKQVVKVGPRVMSLHVLAPYVGWEKFKPLLSHMIDALFSKASPVTVRRLGIRYINAINREHHGIEGVQDLNFNIVVGDDKLTEAVNLNFRREISENMQCLVRVVTPELLIGTIPQDTSVVIDVDVFTPDRFSTTSKADVKKWMTHAHDVEKRAFFQLLTQKTINELREV